MPNWTTEDGESLFNSDLATEQAQQTSDRQATDQEIDQAIGEALGTLVVEGQPLVWWLTQDDLVELMDSDREEELQSPLPEWLLIQLRSANGRNGRGRLWVDSRFGNIDIGDSFNQESLLAEHCAECCGIVISRQDLSYLTRLPGTVTDLLLRRVELFPQQPNVIVWRGSVTDLATDVAYLLTRDGGQQLINELNRFLTLPHLASKFQGRG